MSGTRRKQKITLAGPQKRNYDHERKSNDLPINSRVAPAIVDDPIERGCKLLVLRSVRDDPLAAMRAAGQIDDAQYRGGRKWQDCYELSEIGGVQAIDPSKEKVDGGGIPQMGLSEVQSEALDEITEANAMLAHPRHGIGQSGEAMVRCFLGRRMTIAQIANAFGSDSEGAKREAGRTVRTGLNLLAIHFHLAHRSASKPEDDNYISLATTRASSKGGVK